MLQHAAKVDSTKGTSKWKHTLVAHENTALKEKRERDDRLNTLTTQLEAERKREKDEKMHIEKLEKMINTLLESDNILIRKKLQEGYNLLHVESILKVHRHRTEHRWLRNAFGVWKGGVQEEVKNIRMSKI